MEHLIEAADLHSRLGDSSLRIVDICITPLGQKGYIPGAVRLSPNSLIHGAPPAPGAIPDQARLEQLFSMLGHSSDLTYVLYDDEGGGWAGRMAWTLDMIGHSNWLYLNGGLHAWLEAGLPLASSPSIPSATAPTIELSHDAHVTAEELMALIKHPEQVSVWDARSYPEYTGEKAVAARGGRIPGAKHLEWTDCMDPARSFRIREDMVELAKASGLNIDDLLVTHCQTHHRSGLTYMIGRILGWNIKAYDGSWGEWGNRSDTPIELD